jgi:RNA polymerase primary sigma factor
MAADRGAGSLDEPCGPPDDERASLSELLADRAAEDPYDDVLARSALEDLRAPTERLEERERTVLHSHFGLGRPRQTLREIARVLGVRAERVRQLEERALAKLRAAATG